MLVPALVLALPLLIWLLILSSILLSSVAAAAALAALPLLLLQASESQLRTENENLRKESKEKNALLAKITDTDRGAKAREQAVSSCGGGLEEVR